MKIVFLDAKTIGDDIDLSEFHQLGEVVKYDNSTSEEVPSRVTDADVIITNKVKINADTVGKAKNLKLVCLTATGTDNVDKDYLAQRDIGWRNVAGYSTNSVAGHTFSMLFYLLTKTRYYDDYVKTEAYVNDHIFTHFDEKFYELAGKTWGIIGLGAIGRQVANIAKAFGCHVIYYSTSGQNSHPDYEQVDFETLLKRSDIISIHAPLTDATFNLIDADALEKMKPTAILINVGRGPIIDEQALAHALNNDVITAAGLDVLTVEPMLENNPLRCIKDSKKLLITPHIAWASVEARTRLMKLVLNNIVTYFE
ncbi:MAG: D-2-hydroxyacid dehydrogenase [Defluviitaleaceae bacterium]|nr:D-2-hydroxyacid dehydrogenase [Defluviitaleaceae bacterium]